MSRSCLAALFVVTSTILGGCASTPPPPPEPIGLAGLPARITVSEWPFWVDISTESKDFERTWRVVIDIVSERAAIGVLDKESGYVRTEWRPVDMGVTLFAVPGRQRGRLRASALARDPRVPAAADTRRRFAAGAIPISAVGFFDRALLGPTRVTRGGQVSAAEGITSEQRYTFRIRTAESKIRMGIEARMMPSQQWATGLRNIPNAPWVGIHRELQDRLVIR